MRKNEYCKFQINNYCCCPLFTHTFIKTGLPKGSQIPHTAINLPPRTDQLIQIGCHPKANRPVEACDTSDRSKDSDYTYPGFQPSKLMKSQDGFVANVKKYKLLSYQWHVSGNLCKPTNLSLGIANKLHTPPPPPFPLPYPPSLSQICILFRPKLA